MYNQEREIYKFGRFVLDKYGHRLQAGKRDISLTPKIFDLLLMLVENQGRVLSLKELMHSVWLDVNVEEATVSRHISLLRKALGGNPSRSKYIQTFPKKGYKFTAKVKRVTYQDIAQVEHCKQPYRVEGGLSDSKAKDCPLPENCERIWKLLFPYSGAMELYPADDHPLKDIPKGHLTYPNEERAMQAIRNLLREAKEVVEEKYPSDPTNFLVCLGSSVSHTASRTIMGDPQNKKPFIYIGPDYKIDFPYTIRYLSHTVKRLQDGKTRETPNYAVINQKTGSMAIPSWKGKRLVTDILLVTRIPRILGGPDVLIFAGLHGPAIRAVELLLYGMDMSDIEYLEKCVEGSNYFQAVFHITELGEEENTTVPLRIECDKSKDFKPRRIKVRYPHSSPSKFVRG